MTAQEVLDREYLEVRAKILEIAASLDRLQRAEGDVRQERRMELLQQALQVLVADSDQRAEQIQMIFSREYDKSWREKFGLDRSRKAK